MTKYHLNFAKFVAITCLLNKDAAKVSKKIKDLILDNNNEIIKLSHDKSFNAETIADYNALNENLLIMYQYLENKNDLELIDKIMDIMSLHVVYLLKIITSEFNRDANEFLAL